MRIDTQLVYSIYIRVLRLTKIEYSRARYSRSQSDRRIKKRFLKHKLLSILKTNKNRYIHIEVVRKKATAFIHFTHYRTGIKIIYESYQGKLFTNTTKN